MERHTGWKPLPILLKIIWVLLLVGVVFSIPALFTAPAAGYSLFGYNVFGLWAANLMFLVNVIMPVLLIIAMMKRYSWTWIYGCGLYLFMILNELFMLKGLDQMVDLILAGLPEEYFEIVPDIRGLVYGSAIAGVIIGVLADVFFMLMFFIKRNYFIRKDTDLSMQNPGGMPV